MKEDSLSVALSRRIAASRLREEETRRFTETVFRLAFVLAFRTRRRIPFLAETTLALMQFIATKSRKEKLNDHSVLGPGRARLN